MDDGSVQPVVTRTASYEQCQELAQLTNDEVITEPTIINSYWKCITIDLDSVDTNPDLHSNSDVDDPDTHGSKL